MSCGCKNKKSDCNHKKNGENKIMANEQMINSQINQLAFQEIMKGADPDDAIKKASDTVEKMIKAAKKLAKQYPEEG